MKECIECQRIPKPKKKLKCILLVNVPICKHSIPDSINLDTQNPPPFATSDELQLAHEKKNKNFISP